MPKPWVILPYVCPVSQELSTYEECHYWQKGENGASHRGYTLGM